MAFSFEHEAALPFFHALEGRFEALRPKMDRSWKVLANDRSPFLTRRLRLADSAPALLADLERLVASVSRFGCPYSCFR